MQRALILRSIAFVGSFVFFVANAAFATNAGSANHSLNKLNSALHTHPNAITLDHNDILMGYAGQDVAPGHLAGSTLTA